jgi:glycine/D-amino acid oxidase-like deaminating enzyme
MRVGIIGSGIIGLSIGAELVAHGFEVDCFSSSTLTASSDARSGALIPALGRRKTSLLGRLQRESLALYPSWLYSVGCYEPLVRILPVRRSAALQRCRSLEADEVSEGGEVDTFELVKTLRECIGVTHLHDCIVGSVRFTSQDVDVITNNGAQWKCDRVVAACGRFLSPFLVSAQCKIPFELIPDWGQMLGITIQEPLEEILLVDQWTIIPKREGTVWITGLHEEGRVDTGTQAIATNALYEVAERCFGNRWKEVEQWAGVRPRRRGGVPYVGTLAEDPRCIVAGGHGSNGFLLAPITAKAVADIIKNEVRAFDVVAATS